MKFLLSLLTLALLLSAKEVSPIPTTVEVHKEKAQLGKKLFLDPRLSGDGTIACASCHNLHSGGADSAAFSFGVGGSEGTINTPTVYNARYNFAQFWDGRARTLKDQALVPILNPIEMNNTVENLVATLSAAEEYRNAFDALYEDGITAGNVVDAIVEFEKALITPNSRFDRFLRGEEEALDAEEVEGFELFTSRGCIACHNGINIGGGMYQKLGVIIPYDEYATHKSQRGHSEGRFEFTKRERDKEFFKVPSLRNIALTAPYLHEGSVKSLPQVVELMAVHQLGRSLQPEEVRKIAPVPLEQAGGYGGAPEVRTEPRRPCLGQVCGRCGFVCLFSHGHRFTHTRETAGETSLIFRRNRE